jgi:hypothetical protein
VFLETFCDWSGTGEDYRLYRLKLQHGGEDEVSNLG